MATIRSTACVFFGVCIGFIAYGGLNIVFWRVVTTCYSVSLDQAVDYAIRLVFGSEDTYAFFQLSMFSIVMILGGVFGYKYSKIPIQKTRESESNTNAPHPLD